MTLKKMQRGSPLRKAIVNANGAIDKICICPVLSASNSTYAYERARGLGRLGGSLDPELSLLPLGSSMMNVHDHAQDPSIRPSIIDIYPKSISLRPGIEPCSSQLRIPGVKSKLYAN